MRRTNRIGVTGVLAAVALAGRAPATVDYVAVNGVGSSGRTYILSARAQT